MVFLGFEAKTFDMHTQIKATTLRKFWLDFGDIYKKKKSYYLNPKKLKIFIHHFLRYYLMMAFLL